MLQALLSAERGVLCFCRRLPGNDSMMASVAEASFHSIASGWNEAGDVTVSDVKKELVCSAPNVCKDGQTLFKSA